MINIYSESSFLGSFDSSIRNNLKLPKLSKMFNTINQIDTFCLISAKCALNDKYLNICNELIGNNTYQEFLNFFKN